MFDKELSKIFNNEFKKNYNIHNRIIEFIDKYLYNINKEFKEKYCVVDEHYDERQLFEYEVIYYNNNKDKRDANESEIIMSHYSNNCKDFSNDYRIRFFTPSYLLKCNVCFEDLLKVLQTTINKKITNILQYLYNSIADDIYNVFNISKEDYIVSIGKIYNDDKLYKNKMVPYIIYNNNIKMKILLHDIGGIFSENKSSVNNYLLFLNYDKLIYNNYKDDSSKFKECELSLDSIVSNDGYIVRCLMLGNIVNNIIIKIINRSDNNGIIIRYNNKGISPKIIKNFNSLYEVSKYNKKFSNMKNQHYNKLSFNDCITSNDINNKLIEINYYSDNNLRLKYIDIINNN